MAQSRKLAVILFTDIEGYTSMMGKDEASTINVVHQMHQLQIDFIEQNGGIVVKKLGDGLMAYFNDSEKAVSCALEIQKSVSKVFEASLRIGMHKAEIVISDDDIYGDGVNIAARIEPLADPGGVYISEDVQRDISANINISTRLMGSAKLKNVGRKIEIYAILDAALPEPSESRFQKLANPKKKLPVVPTLIIFLLIVMAAYFIIDYFNQAARISEAQASKLRVEKLVNTNWRDYSEAYYLAKEVEEVIPEDDQLKELIDRSSVRVNITTEPPGADIYIKIYMEPEAEWQYLGKTPLDSAELPKSAIRWKIEKEGYVTTYAASQSSRWGAFTRDQLLVGQDFHRDLFRKEEMPEGMVYVSPGNLGYGILPGFFIDRLETTNAQYKEFVDVGGYEEDEYWQDLVNMVGDTTDWRQVRASFTDRTGKAGPSTWNDGKFPDGMENYPVTGISWFEANAFARFAGKELPTKDHWGLAYGVNLMIVAAHQMGGNAILAPFRNYQSDGPWEAGSSHGFDPYGTYDLGGNVREWCWNKNNNGRWMRGGAWLDNPYMGKNASQANPLDRSEINGFRCMLLTDSENTPEQAYAPVENFHPFHKVRIPEPITDKEFMQLRDQYEYDELPLDVVVEWSEDNPDWTLKKVTINAAYDDERIPLYIFLPKNTKPPYQSVLYGYGSGAFMWRSSDNIEKYYEFPAFLDFLVYSGRAVIMPVVKETFERGDKNSHLTILNFDSYQYTDLVTRVVKDYRRTIDYLESQSDLFDQDKLCFYGMSFGPFIGQFLTAVDDRVDANIFYAGGTVPIGKRESNPTYFLPRITIPTLMVNGRYDANFRIDHEIKAMYDLMGTPEENKKLLLFDSDHLAPREDFVRESLIWLDAQFGPLNDDTRVAGNN